MNPLSLLSRSLPVLSAVLLSLPAMAQSTSSPLIAFQSLVTDQQTNVIQSGKFAITFQIYDQPVGGTLLWSERHEEVSVQQGMINVILGSGASLSPVTFASQRYLGITVHSDSSRTQDAEMPGRPALLPAFWAKNSDKLAGYDWTALFASNSPAGTFLPSKIGTNSIATDRLKANAVTADKLAANAVTAEKLAPGAVGPENLRAGSVASIHLQDGTITDSDIGILALTQSKREAAPMAISPSLPGGFAVRNLPGGGGGASNISLDPVALPTTGRRPVWVGLTSGTNDSPSNIRVSGGESGVAKLTIRFKVDGIVLSSTYASVQLGTGSFISYITPSSISTILPPLPAGASRLVSIDIETGNPSQLIIYNDLRIFAFEL